MASNYSKKIYYFIPLIIFLLVFISSCKTQSRSVEIKNAEYKDGVILLTLISNQSLADVGIEISSGGKTLCIKHKDLDSGTNHFEFSDCDLEDQIKVSVFPRQGISSEKDFNLGLPILKLQEGYRYDFSMTTCPSCSPLDISIYVTDETKEEWKGIAGLKKDNQMAYLLRFKIGKSDMRLLTTETLNENQINDRDVNYQSPNNLNGEVLYSFSPLFLLVFKEKGLDLDGLMQNKAVVFIQQNQNLTIEATEIKDGFLVNKIAITSTSQPEERWGTFYSSTLKPYIIVKIEAREGAFYFKGSEKKSFSLEDYSGYTLDEMPQKALEQPSRELQSEPIEEKPAVPRE